MDRISDLSDDLLVKILSFLPTRVAVSTSILSKRWECLWMWLPKLEYTDSDIKGSAIRCRDFIDKNLPLHRAPVIESLLLQIWRHGHGLLQPQNIKLWVEIAVSRCVRELSFSYLLFRDDPPDLPLPSSLYTCNSLEALKLEGKKIFVYVPPTVCLPSLKTLQLRLVTYPNENSLQLLLSHCPALECLLIDRRDEPPYLSLPSSLYTCNSLKTLRLGGKKILVDVPQTVCLPSLKSLELQCVTYSNEVSLLLLLSHCPVLEDLLIDRDEGDEGDELPYVSLPSSLFTCNSLKTLKLGGKKISVDVPRTVCLPSLKTLQLLRVTYSNEDSLRLLLSCCPVLKDLLIERAEDDNVRALVVTIPSLQRLSLKTYDECPSGGYVIVTPSLKYLKLVDFRDTFSCLIEHMPKLKEAEINDVKDFEQLLESIKSVRRLSLRSLARLEEESSSLGGIVFNQLERFKLCICSEYWPKFLVSLLRNSPKLRFFSLRIDRDVDYPVKWEYLWKNELRSSVPECLLTSLETFKFSGYSPTQEEKDFLSYVFKHASCLKSMSIKQ